MALTDDEKRARKRDRMLEKAREYTTGTYCRKFVSPLFQKMIRAEFGAVPANETPVIFEGELDYTLRKCGECACVTCGTVKAWDSGIKGIHTGHFLASRCNSILLVESNVAPQCSHCNFYRSGAPQAFRKWMLAVRGQETVERLERLKTESRTFQRDELVDLRIGFAGRLKAAEDSMRGR